MRSEFYAQFWRPTTIISCVICSNKERLAFHFYLVWISILFNSRFRSLKHQTMDGGGGIAFVPLKDLYILHTLFAVKHLTTWERERNVHTIKIEKHRWIQIDMNCDFIKRNKCTELLLLLPSFHTHFTFIVRQNNAMKNRLFVFLFHASLSIQELFFVVYRILIKSLLFKCLSLFGLISFCDISMVNWDLSIVLLDDDETGDKWDGKINLLIILIFYGIFL